ncbi:Irregular chiasm C-roughest protein [Toxocara canis]|uniref:Irregular chiasm C-roughest protein n=1 Tax=Toxocara canis TaxID=6265 RepID=A0A0B2VX05_TOXCA|nr:Irregular chiasm C-roughest protein [Toxocara canis]
MRWLLVWMVVTLRSRAQPQQRIVEGPSDTSAMLGETQGAVQWVKNGFGLGNDRQLSAFKRYSMEGSASKGEYNLRITEVDIEDDDVYECQIQAAGSNPSRISNPAKLTVLVEPQPPKLQVGGSVLKAVAGQRVQQSCVSKRGKPPATVRWVIAEDAEATDVLIWLEDQQYDKRDSHNAHITEDVHRTDERTYTVISNISFAPRAEDDEKYLACVVSHETYPSIKVQSVFLALSYAPKVELKLDNNSVLREHGSALLSCSVKAKPFENVEIVWYRNGKAISSATTDTLSFPELRIDHHQSQYVCLARNSIGESSASYVLNVSYGAHIMSNEQHQAVSPGEDAFFHCEAIGNPKPVIHWIKSGDNRTIARGNNFTLRSVQSWQRGEYDCVATVEGFPAAILTNYLHIRGPPSVSLTEETAAAVGESVEIICEVRGRPQPRDVLWSLNGLPLEYGRPGGRIQVHQVPRQFGVESKLIIRSIKDSDFGTYNCTAFNELGHDFQTMELKRKSVVDVVIKVLPWSYAVPLALFAFAALLLLVCCCLWRCYRKKYKKASRLGDEQLEVTVKCEALDGGQFFPEMYSSSPPENSELICSKDYVPIPQNNPDLDYLPPPTFIGNIYQPYLNQPVEYSLDPSVRFEPAYGSFTSGISTSAGATLSDVYAGNTSQVEGTVLETLTEVATPDMESGTPLLLNAARVHERPVSRTSTHV